jgi:hypothetical protein
VSRLLECLSDSRLMCVEPSRTCVVQLTTDSCSGYKPASSSIARIASSREEQGQIAEVVDGLTGVRAMTPNNVAAVADLHRRIDSASHIRGIGRPIWRIAIKLGHVPASVRGYQEPADAQHTSAQILCGRLKRFH